MEFVTERLRVPLDLATRDADSSEDGVLKIHSGSLAYSWDECSRSPATGLPSTLLFALSWVPK